MKLQRAMALTTLLTGLVGGAAQALAAQATASLYDITFTLVDLAPDDGIAPELIFTPGFDWGMGTSGSARVSRTDGGAIRTDDLDLYSQAFSPSALLSPGTASATLEGTSATASSTSDSFTATAVATQAPLSSDLSRDATAEVHAIANNHPAGFLLSANTSLLLMGRYSLAAALDDTGASGDQARAHVTLDISFGADAAHRQLVSLSRSILVGRSAGLPLADSSSGDFAFSFYNTGQTAWQGVFGNRVVHAEASIGSPVPEPHAPTMLLCTLGAWAALNARQRMAWRDKTLRKPG
jgi:hypothetical protein